MKNSEGELIADTARPEEGSLEWKMAAAILFMPEIGHLTAEVTKEIIRRCARVATEHFDGPESWPCYACGRCYPTQQEAHDCEHSDGDAAPCCDYRDHSPGPCTCPDHERSEMHPFGEHIDGCSTDRGTPQ